MKTCYKNSVVNTVEVLCVPCSAHFQERSLLQDEYRMIMGQDTNKRQRRRGLKPGRMQTGFGLSQCMNFV